MEAAPSLAEEEKGGAMQDAGGLGFGGGKWQSHIRWFLSTCKIIF